MRGAFVVDRRRNGLATTAEVTLAGRASEVTVVVAAPVALLALADGHPAAAPAEGSGPVVGQLLQAAAKLDLKLLLHVVDLFLHRCTREH